MIGTILLHQMGKGKIILRYYGNLMVLWEFNLILVHYITTEGP